MASACSRFVEIGKRDIWSTRRAAQERPDVVYNLLAIDFMPVSVLQCALRRLTGRLAAGTAQALPLVQHGISEAGTALRQLSQVRNF